MVVANIHTKEKTIRIIIFIPTLYYMKKRKHTTITIPNLLYEKIKDRIKGTGFTSVSDYVTYVLREIISSLEEEKKEEVFTKKEEEKVKERLKALGYME